MRARTWILVAAGVAMALGALAGADGVKKLSAFGVAGTSGGIRLIADYDAARLRGGEKFIPVKIWLGNDGTKPIYAGRTSFTLKDPGGASHPLPSPESLVQGYGPDLVGSDYGYYENLPDYGSSSYLACQEIRKVAFFANPAGNPKILYDTVELPRQTFFWTLLYFENPAGRAQGTYTLIYDDPKSGTHIEVPFTVPWMEPRKKK